MLLMHLKGITSRWRCHSRAAAITCPAHCAVQPAPKLEPLVSLAAPELEPLVSLAAPSAWPWAEPSQPIWRNPAELRTTQSPNSEASVSGRLAVDALSWVTSSMQLEPSRRSLLTSTTGAGGGRGGAGGGGRQENEGDCEDEKNI
jgi:hypothetical protein